MHTKTFLLTLLLALLTFTVALPAVDATSGIAEEMDNLPLADVPYPTDTITSDNGEVEGLFTSGNVTGMGDFDGWYKCETTGGSPSARDVTGAAIKFDQLGNTHCVQENATGSLCTKMVHFWSAAVSVCGPYKNWIFCYRVSFAANTIAQRCEWNGLAGGYFVFNDPSALRFPIHRNHG